MNASARVQDCRRGRTSDRFYAFGQVTTLACSSGSDDGRGGVQGRRRSRTCSLDDAEVHELGQPRSAELVHLGGEALGEILLVVDRAAVIDET
jgi:hypothetical protein